MNLGAPELIIILALVLLLFGTTRLPKLARSLGQASREFKHGADEGLRDESDVALPEDRAGERPRTPKASS